MKFSRRQLLFVLSIHCTCNQQFSDGMRQSSGMIPHNEQKEIFAFQFLVPASLNSRNFGRDKSSKCRERRYKGSQFSSLRCLDKSPIGMNSSGIDTPNLHSRSANLVSTLHPSEKCISKSIQEILRIAADKDLSEMERIQLIRNALPAPIFPYETEPGMMGETRVAKSFGHLNDLLFLDSWAEHSDKLGPCKLYRGVPDSSMELLTSLQARPRRTRAPRARPR